MLLIFDIHTKFVKFRILDPKIQMKRAKSHILTTLGTESV